MYVYGIQTSMERAALVCQYFKLGLNNKEILQCLEQMHRVIISMRTLKRITKRCGLYHRNTTVIFYKWWSLLPAIVKVMVKCMGTDG